ncbi:MAG: ThiF family adenylyltransferase [Fibrobacter sp.]|nr:ThiF family adenylyltransferase [Fibrobacter sp.]
MNDYYSKMVSRNIGIFSTEEQQKIKNAKVAIAGAGGVGGLLAERLIRLGVNFLKISDPETFEISNLNRQLGCNSETIGKFKASVIKSICMEINPEAEIIIDTNGITDQNSAQELCKDVNICVDEMDYGLFDQSVYLDNAIHKNNGSYIFSSAIGFCAVIYTFGPRCISLEKFNYFRVNQTKADPDSCYKKVLSNSSVFLKGKESLIEDIIQGKIPAPTNSIGVGLTSVITAFEVMNVILHPESYLAKEPIRRDIDLFKE